MYKRQLTYLLTCGSIHKLIVWSTTYETYYKVPAVIDRFNVSVALTLRSVISQFTVHTSCVAEAARLPIMLNVHLHYVIGHTRVMLTATWRVW